MLRPILVLVMIVQVGIPLRAQGNDVDRELEEAKALYREAKFAQAIAKLQATIGRLEQLRDIQARKIQLSDAHLHLALSYVALNDPAAAKESLKHMLRADRNRKLDPDVYAPKVIEVFEEAKKEVAAEPAAAAPPPPSATARKGGSKTPLILLGAAAAAGGGIAVAKGGGSSTGATPAATPTTTPTPAPAVSGSNDIVIVSSTPPFGSSLSVGRRDVLTLAVSAVVNRAARDAFIRINFIQVEGGPCAFGDSEPFSLTAGQAHNVNVPIGFGSWQANVAGCELPAEIREIHGHIQGGFMPSFNRPLAVNFRVVP